MKSFPSKVKLIAAFTVLLSFSCAVLSYSQRIPDALPIVEVMLDDNVLKAADEFKERARKQGKYVEVYIGSYTTPALNDALELNTIPNIGAQFIGRLDFFNGKSMNASNVIKFITRWDCVFLEGAYWVAPRIEIQIGDRFNYIRYEELYRIQNEVNETFIIKYPGSGPDGMFKSIIEASPQVRSALVKALNRLDLSPRNVISNCYRVKVDKASSTYWMNYSGSSQHFEHLGDLHSVSSSQLDLDDINQLEDILPVISAGLGIKVDYDVTFDPSHMLERRPGTDELAAKYAELYDIYTNARRSREDFFSKYDLGIWLENKGSFKNDKEHCVMCINMIAKEEGLYQELKRSETLEIIRKMAEQQVNLLEAHNMVVGFALLRYHMIAKGITEDLWLPSELLKYQGGKGVYGTRLYPIEAGIIKVIRQELIEIAELLKAAGKGGKAMVEYCWNNKVNCIPAVVAYHFYEYLYKFLMDENFRNKLLNACNRVYELAVSKTEQAIAKRMEKITTSNPADRDAWIQYTVGEVIGIFVAEAITDMAMKKGLQAAKVISQIHKFSKFSDILLLQKTDDIIVRAASVVEDPKLEELIFGWSKADQNKFFQALGDEWFFNSIKTMPPASVNQFMEIWLRLERSGNTGAMPEVAELMNHSDFTQTLGRLDSEERTLFFDQFENAEFVATTTRAPGRNPFRLLTVWRIMNGTYTHRFKPDAALLSAVADKLDLIKELQTSKEFLDYFDQKVVPLGNDHAREFWEGFAHFSRTEIETAHLTNSYENIDAPKIKTSLAFTGAWKMLYDQLIDLKFLIKDVKGSIKVFDTNGSECAELIDNGTDKYLLMNYYHRPQGSLDDFGIFNLPAGVRIRAPVKLQDGSFFYHDITGNAVAVKLKNGNIGFTFYDKDIFNLMDEWKDLAVLRELHQHLIHEVFVLKKKVIKGKDLLFVHAHHGPEGFGYGQETIDIPKLAILVRKRPEYGKKEAVCLMSCCMTSAEAQELSELTATPILFHDKGVINIKKGGAEYELAGSPGNKWEYADANDIEPLIENLKNDQGFDDYFTREVALRGDEAQFWEGIRHLSPEHIRIAMEKRKFADLDVPLQRRRSQRPDGDIVMLVDPDKKITRELKRALTLDGYEFKETSKGFQGSFKGETTPFIEVTYGPAGPDIRMTFPKSPVPPGPQGSRRPHDPTSSDNWVRQLIEYATPEEAAKIIEYLERNHPEQMRRIRETPPQSDVLQPKAGNPSPDLAFEKTGNINDPAFAKTGDINDQAFAKTGNAEDPAFAKTGNAEDPALAKTGSPDMALDDTGLASSNNGTDSHPYLTKYGSYRDLADASNRWGQSLRFLRWLERLEKESDNLTKSEVATLLRYFNNKVYTPADNELQRLLDLLELE